MHNYVNDNKLFECKWSPTTVKNIKFASENLAKKVIEKVSEVRKIISN